MVYKTKVQIKILRRLVNAAYLFEHNDRIQPAVKLLFLTEQDCDLKRVSDIENC
jgi:hypothetical protein